MQVMEHKPAVLYLLIITMEEATVCRVSGGELSAESVVPPSFTELYRHFQLAVHLSGSGSLSALVAPN